MKRLLLFAALLFLTFVAANAGDEKKAPAIVARVSEVKPGSVTTDHRCVLILPDHRFHLERATRKRDKDLMRKVYEGQLTQPEWDELIGILNAADFKALAVPSTRG